MRTRLAISTATLFLAALLSQSARASVLYTTFLTDWQSVLAKIDPDTGVVTVLGPMAANIQSLAYDSKSDVLYAGAGSYSNGYVYRVNRTNGSTTLVATSSAVTSISGMAYDSLRDKLYGGGTLSSGVLGFFEISKSGAISGVTQPANGIAALEYYPPADQLLFTGYGGTSRVFGSIDRTTGEQVITANLFGTELYGLGYDPSTSILYGLAGSGNPDNRLFKINPSTGQPQLLRHLSRSEYYASMAVIVPEPGVALLFIIGITLLPHLHQPPSLQMRSDAF